MIFRGENYYRLLSEIAKAKLKIITGIIGVQARVRNRQGYLHAAAEWAFKPSFQDSAWYMEGD